MPKPKMEARERRRLGRFAAAEDMLAALDILAARPLHPMPEDAQTAYRGHVASIRGILTRARAAAHLGRAPRAWIADAPPVDGVTTDQPKE